MPYRRYSRDAGHTGTKKTARIFGTSLQHARHEWRVTLCETTQLSSNKRHQAMCYFRLRRRSRLFFGRDSSMWSRTRHAFSPQRGACRTSGVYRQLDFSGYLEGDIGNPAIDLRSRGMQLACGWAELATSLVSVAAAPGGPCPATPRPRAAGEVGRTLMLPCLQVQNCPQTRRDCRCGWPCLVGVPWVALPACRQSATTAKIDC